MMSIAPKPSTNRSSAGASSPEGLLSFFTTASPSLMAAIEKIGAKIVMPKVTIPTVGTLIFVEDPEGNLAGAMQYQKSLA